MKNQLIIETYNGKTLDATKSQEGVPEGMLRAEGVLAVVETVNRNGRFYKADMYKRLVNEMKGRIKAENGIFGEMEHPRSMNIDLNRISHKIEDVSFNESTGEVRGKILLLDTPSGKIAQSVLKSGSNLPISSRAIGKINEDKSVDVKTLGTFDLVGTAGFKQASLQIAESKDESGLIICESYAYDIDDNGNVITESAADTKSVEAIVEAVIKKLGLVNEDKALQIAKTFVLEEAAPKIRSFVNEAEGKGAVGLQKSDVINIMNERFSTVYAPVIQKWVVEEYTPTVEQWLYNDYASTT